MAKSFLSRPDLEQAVLLQIRGRYGCEEVISIALNKIEDPRFETNWGILSIQRPRGGEMDVRVAKQNLRAIAATHDRLRPIYNLGGV